MNQRFLDRVLRFYRQQNMIFSTDWTGPPLIRAALQLLHVLVCRKGEIARCTASSQQQTISPVIVVLPPDESGRVYEENFSLRRDSHL